MGKSWRLLVLVGALVVGWFALAEMATRFWYSTHEAKLTRNRIPAKGEDIMERLKAFATRDGSPSKDQDIGAAATDLLKCAYGKTLIWADPSGASAATILKWDENSIVGGLETQHNPGICLSAAGWKVGRQTSLGLQKMGSSYCNVTEWEVSRNGMDMRAFSAVFRRFAESEEAKAEEFQNSERLKSVLAGRRDAPVLVLLAYLPTGDSNSQAASRFREILQAVFAEPASGEPHP